jgi:predicted nucleic acid-binding protein
VTNLGDPLYADTSALVKLIIDEQESESLDRYLSASELQLTSSVICEVELLRAVSRVEQGRLSEARQLLDEMILLPLTTDIRDRAASIQPPSVRSLDAMHLATALEIQADLHALVSYDNRLVDTARGTGIKAISPGT